MPENPKPPVRGAAPAGTQDQHSAARAVREMFTSVAPRYDLLNHVLSFNVDRIWWRRAARTFRPIISRPDARVLDICCGTGEMAFALGRAAGKSPACVMGADFSRAMLERAMAKSRGRPDSAPILVEADALSLPFPNARFDLVTSAFGFRNLANYDAGLGEIIRVLRPGGECGILDFGEPKGLLGQIYRLYFKQVLPRIGAVISGVKGPYAYLPASVERFPPPEQMIMRMKAVGFAEPTWTPYTFGIAGLYRGKKL